MAPLNHRLETSFWKNPIPSDNFLERSIDPSNFSVENAPFALDPNVYTADQRLQQRIVQLLDEQEQVTFQVYRKEYFNRNMDLQTFVSLLLPLLNTPGKVGVFFLKFSISKLYTVFVLNAFDVHLVGEHHHQHQW